MRRRDKGGRIRDRWRLEQRLSLSRYSFYSCSFILLNLRFIMKKIALFLLLALPAAVRAQEFRMKFASAANRKVVLDMRGSDVTVEGYDGDELLIRGSGHYEAPPALANGLRPIYSGGATDNTHLGLAVTPAGDNTLRIVRTSGRGDDGHYTVRVPRLTDVSFAQNGWGGSDDLTIRDLAGRVEVSLNSGDLRLLNVSGPVVANTVSGDIKVQFSALPTQPSAITAVSGDVDLTLPPRRQGEPLDALDFGRNLHRLRPQPGRRQRPAPRGRPNRGGPRQRRRRHVLAQNHQRRHFRAQGAVGFRISSSWFLVSGC